jgi:hypothetical protein
MTADRLDLLWEGASRPETTHHLRADLVEGEPQGDLVSSFEAIARSGSEANPRE